MSTCGGMFRDHLETFFGNIGIATFLHVEISDAIFFIESAHPKGWCYGKQKIENSLISHRYESEYNVYLIIGNM